LSIVDYQQFVSPLLALSLLVAPSSCFLRQVKETGDEVGGPKIGDESLDGRDWRSAMIVPHDPTVISQ
jgi:hypothetical protein